MTTNTHGRFSMVAGIGVLALLASACSHPPTTRSGAVHSIRVMEAPVPDDVVVNAGDEVRWVNARNLPIRVDLVGLHKDDVSCERGFSNLFGTVRESAKIDPNDSASLCFVQAGAVNYNVRMDSALPGGEKIVSGVVRIGGTTK
jgi:plastocyanin